MQLAVSSRAGGRGWLSSFKGASNARNSRTGLVPASSILTATEAAPVKRFGQSRPSPLPFRASPRRSAHLEAGCVGSSSNAAALGVQGSRAQARRWSWVRAALIALVAVVVSYLTGPALASAPTAPAPAGVVARAISFVLHIDEHLASIIASAGAARTLAFLSAIVFAETGLVVTPFLPGDSLLFAAGAISASTPALGLLPLVASLCVAAIAGDCVNYACGSFFGRRLMAANVIRRSHIEKTEAFYDKHGGKTVVLARFVPIVRTFAPFVAGVGSMSYKAFAAYNVAGALIWTVSFTLLGFYFGNLPFVKHNFTLVILAIVAVSVLPVAYEVLASWRQGSEGGGEAESA